MVEDKQVTAVWFLIKELSDKIAFTPGSELALWHAQLYERALQLEREQIEDAFKHGQNNGFMYHERGFDTISSNQFYKQIYGGNNE
jgi:hypothetical protein